MKKSPQTQILLCLSTCRAPAKPRPGDCSSPQDHLGPEPAPSPNLPSLRWMHLGLIFSRCFVEFTLTSSGETPLELASSEGESPSSSTGGQNSVGSCLPVRVPVGVQRGATSRCSRGAIPQQKRGRQRQQELEAMSPNGFSAASAHSRSPRSQPCSDSGNPRPVAHSHAAVSCTIWSTPGKALC